eukprot:1367807-Amorphochlora_amoeboformis.AAC.1
MTTTSNNVRIPLPSPGFFVLYPPVSSLERAKRPGDSAMYPFLPSTGLNVYICVRVSENACSLESVHGGSAQ